MRSIFSRRNSLSTRKTFSDPRPPPSPSTSSMRSNGMMDSRSMMNMPFKYLTASSCFEVTQTPSSPSNGVTKTSHISAKKMMFMSWFTQNSICTFTPERPSMNEISYGVTSAVNTSRCSVIKSHIWTYRWRGFTTCHALSQKGSASVNTGFAAPKPCVATMRDLVCSNSFLALFLSDARRRVAFASPPYTLSSSLTTDGGLR
mmetsp:Transcript_7555/g.32118  ORF Transcript_7555/g.32118 Transcript_7555/m.32118 type:complete len:202 (-) Transcript_7555:269-874(-)